MFFNLLKEKVILNFFEIWKELYEKVKSLLLWKQKNERVNYDNYLKLQQRITVYFLISIKQKTASLAAWYLFQFIKTYCSI